MSIDTTNTFYKIKINKQQTSTTPQLKSAESGTNSNTTKKVTLAGLTGLAAVGIYLATRGKTKIKLTPEQELKINELLQSGRLNIDTLEIFKSLQGLEGEQFIKEAYKKIAKLMGYDKHTCPELKITKENLANSSDYDFIVIDKISFPTKESQIASIRHELEHYRQNELIYRAFGKDASIDCLIAKYINKIKYNDECCIQHLGKKYSDLTDNELQSFRNFLRSGYDTSGNFEKMEQLLSKKEKINKDSNEYLEAKNIYQAKMDYISPTSLVNEPLTVELLDKIEKSNPILYKNLQNALQKYDNNYLEVEANKQENKLRKMYEAFISIFHN